MTYPDTISTAACKIATELDLLLERRPPTPWTERLQLWCGTCRRTPERAFRVDRLGTVLDDLVTLETESCLFELDPAAPGGLVAHDSGGAVCAAATINRALELLLRDAPSAVPELVQRVHDRRVRYRAEIARHIAACV